MRHPLKMIRTGLIGLMLTGVLGSTTVRAAELRSTFDIQVPLAPAPLRIDGADWLVYEVRLHNVSNEPLTLTAVDVLGDGTSLATFDSFALAKRLGRPGGSVGGSEARTLAPGMLLTLYVEVTFPAGPPPSVVSHRVTYVSHGRDAGDAGRVEGGYLAPDTMPVPVLSPPLRGGPWAAVHHPDWVRGHRRMVYAVDGRATIPGRYAIDFVRLDEHGRQAEGDADRVASWFGYGDDVLAVTDGVVVAVRDDMPESTSVKAHPRHPLKDATGNYVVLRIGQGRYAFYEHLRSKSVRVRVGQRVRRGQTLAALGFSGDSTGPHLHFHVADANSPLGAEGVPYVFDRFRALGGYDTPADLGQAPWTAAPEGPKLRRGERPAPNQVIDFGEL